MEQLPYPNNIYISKAKTTFNQKDRAYKLALSFSLDIDALSKLSLRVTLYGQFVFEKTLIIVDAFDWTFDSKAEKWLISIEHDEEERSLLSIDEYIETEIEEVNRDFEEKICDKAVILIHEDELENAENAYKEERFLIYKKDIIEKLALFCEK